MKSNELTQQVEVEKESTLNKAKPFIKELRSLLDKIEDDFNSENSNTQMNGIFHAMALNECIKQYSHHLKEIFEEIEREPTE